MMLAFSIVLENMVVVTDNILTFQLAQSKPIMTSDTSFILTAILRY